MLLFPACDYSSFRLYDLKGELLWWGHPTQEKCDIGCDHCCLATDTDYRGKPITWTQVHQLGLCFAGDDGAGVDSCNLVRVAGSQAQGLLATLWWHSGGHVGTLVALVGNWYKLVHLHVASGVQSGNWLFCGRPNNDAKTCKNPSL